MQIHTVQCAKYRLFQEGYSVTPQMHSCDISCLAGIFYFLFFFFFFPKTAGHLLWRILSVPGGWLQEKIFFFPISSIHLSIFC